MQRENTGWGEPHSHRPYSDPSPPAGLGAESGQAQLPTWPLAWNVLGHSQDLGRDYRASGPLQLQYGGPHLATQVPPSSQGTQVTGFLENWSMQEEGSGFPV